MKTFEVKIRWSTTPDCYLSVEKYAANDHIAISIWSESEGPFADLTVNLSETAKYPKHYGYVDVNNFPEATALIERLGIGKWTGGLFSSGFCTYPLYEFDEEALKKWTEGE